MNTTTNERGEELRDKFAAALTALLSHVHPSTAFATRPPDKEAEDVEHDKVATEAYRWTDAMLRARS